MAELVDVERIVVGAPAAAQVAPDRLGSDGVVLLLAAEVVVEAVDEEVEADDLERGAARSRSPAVGTLRARRGRRSAPTRRSPRRSPPIGGVVTASTASAAAAMMPRRPARRRCKRAAAPANRAVAGERVMCGAAFADRNQPRANVEPTPPARPRRGVSYEPTVICRRAPAPFQPLCSAAVAAGCAEARRERARARSASIVRSRGSAFVTSDPIRRAPRRRPAPPPARTPPRWPSTAR